MTSHAVPTPATDLATFVACLFEPEDLVEVRELPSKRSNWFRACELVRAVDALAANNRRNENIYIGVNPRRRHGGKDAASVLLARCLFVDFDHLDLDGARHAVEQAGLAPPTLWIVSGGGVHVYWRLTEPLNDLAVWTQYQKRLIALLGSDPAIHDPPRIMRLTGFDNHKYSPPRQCQIVEADPSCRYPIADFNAVTTSRSGPALAKRTRTAGCVREGGRNRFLFGQASAMRRRGMSEEAILAGLKAENQNRCGPPLGDAEVADIAKSAGRYTPASRVAAEELWEPPIPLGQFALPEFPLEAIPDGLKPLRSFCAEVARSYQVPVELPALLMLAVAGTALAKRFCIHGEDDWYEPVNLYVVVAMQSGERKSAVFRECVAPLTDFERRQAEVLAPQIAQNRTERAVLAKALEEAMRKAGKAENPEKRWELTQRAKEIAAELQAKPVIDAPRYIADDATPEALTRLLFENGGRMAVLSPEGDTFDLMAGRYSKNGTPNLNVYLKGHAGDDIRVNRVSKDRPPEHVRSPALTVGLAVQPAVLHGLMEKPGFRGKGLLARFIYALPKSRVGYRQLRPGAVSPNVRRQYAQTIEDGLSLTPVFDGAGREAARVLRLTTEAWRELDEFRGLIEAALRDTGKLAPIRDWGSKLPGAVLRIAGIYHALMHGEVATERPIDAETVLCAIAVGQFALDHALAAFFEMGADPAIGIARRLLDWLQEEPITEFSRRDAHSQTRALAQRVDELDAPLRLLSDHGFIREVATDRPGPGRKPSQRFKVNPFLRAQNPQNTKNSVADANCAHSAQSALEG